MDPDLQARMAMHEADTREFLDEFPDVLLMVCEELERTSMSDMTDTVRVARIIPPRHSPQTIVEGLAEVFREYGLNSYDTSMGREQTRYHGRDFKALLQMSSLRMPMLSAASTISSCLILACMTEGLARLACVGGAAAATAADGGYGRLAYCASIRITPQRPLPASLAEDVRQYVSSL